MATAEEILNSPEYKEANLATKRAIFVKHIAKTPDYANANQETQNAIMERFGIAEAEPEEPPPTKEKPSGVPTLSQVGITPDVGGVAGVGLGASSLVAPKVTGASEADIARARERLSAAQDRLKLAEEALKKGPTGNLSIEEIRAINNNAKAAVLQAKEELAAVNQAAREAAKTAPAVISEAVEAMPSRTVPGASGAQNWARAMATQELPESLIEQVETMRKTGPGGAQRLIDEDLARLQKIKELGEGKQRLVGQGRGQLMLPPEEAARLEAEMAERQAAQSAEQARLRDIAERERLARDLELRQRQEAARGNVRAAGKTAAETGQKAKEGIQLSKKVQSAQSGLTLAKQAAKRAEEAKLGPAQRFGAAIGSSKFLSPLLGGLAGVGTVMSIDEAIERYNAGDYSGMVIPTLEAAFGAMSMMPAFNPLTAGIKGLGMAGGLGLGAYQLGRYGVQKMKE